MAAAAILNFGKMPITRSGLDIDLCTKVGGQMRHGYAQMTTTKSRHRKLIRMTSSNERSISASITVTITDICTKFGTELKHHTVNMPECAKFT